MSSSQSLHQKIALVTAGASGLGRTIADTLHSNGAIVHVCDISSDALAGYPTGERASCEKVDVADAEQVKAMVESLNQRYGRLDILVNNAGIAGPSQRVEDIEIEDWQRTMAVDLDSVFYVTKYAVPLLKKSASGVIINMSSNAGLFGCPLRSPYVASKWGIIGLTKTWAMELGPQGIRVNALCPGSVEGARIDAVIERDAQQRDVPEDDVRQIYERQSSLRRFVDPSDIANMVLFLVGDTGRNISGQALSIDGHTESLSNWLDG